MISVIIPFINEKQHLSVLLKQLAPLLEKGHEIILVDGGSTDGFDPAGMVAGVSVYQSNKGRARQMNRGADRAKGRVLWFLHADSRLIQNVEDYVVQMHSGNPSWGRFDVQLMGSKRVFKIIAYLINRRSALSGIATGDQGIFIHRELFDRVGGYDDIDIMEDVNICKKLKTIKKPLILTTMLLTSSRRWSEKGIVSTILLMWLMRFLYFIGVRPSSLIKLYGK